MSSDVILQEQKKRTLEALERRFAVSEAELLQQQQKTSKKRLNEEDEWKHDNMESPFLHHASAKSSSITSYKKGNFAFSGNTKSEGDAELKGPTYWHLSHSVHQNLLGDSNEIVQISNKGGSMVNNVLHEILQNGDASQKYMQGSRNMKIDNYILLDNFVQGRSMLGRAVNSHSKRSRKHMSLRQHKRCGSFSLSPELHKCNIFKPMHEMWKDYMMQLLKNVGQNHMAQCLLTADRHGAVIQVVECKISSFIGVSGIVVRETTETFGIISKDDKFRVVPKKISVFIFRVDCWKITLHGDKLISRNLGV